MNNKGHLLQDPFLNALRKEHVPVSIYLVNGIKLQGNIYSFDQYVVLLKNTVTQMVYKHAISTIVPSRAMKSRSLRTCLRSVASACKPRRTERRNRSIYEYVRIPSTARRRITGAQQDHKQVLSNAPLQ